MHINAVEFLQPPGGSISNLKVQIVYDDFLNSGRFDIDVTLVHPFQGADQFTGFDVMGGFMTDGHRTTQPETGSLTLNDGGSQDAWLMNPDGYTRWWNQDEFTDTGVKLFGYIPGAVGTGASTLDAKLNPYKYFADGLDSLDDLGTFLQNNAAMRGMFGAGSQNTRRYELQWPLVGGTPNFKFDYLVVASWEPANVVPPVNIPDDFPFSANALEPVGVSVTNNSDLIHDPSFGQTGGDISLDVELYDWQGMDPTNSIPNTISRAFVEVLNSPQLIGGAVQEITPLVWSPGQVNSSIITMEFTGITTDTFGDMPVLLSFETVYDYDNGFGSAYPVGEPLTSYFYIELPVAQFGGDQPPACDDVTPEFADRHWLDLEEFSSNAADPEGEPVNIDWSVVPSGNSPSWQSVDSDTILVNWQDVTNNGANLGDYDVCVSVYNGDGGDMCCTTVNVANTPTLGVVPLQDSILLNPQPDQGGEIPDLTVYNSSGSVGQVMEQLVASDVFIRFVDDYSAQLGQTTLNHSGFSSQFNDSQEWEDFARFDTLRNGNYVHLASGDDASPSFTAGGPTEVNINDPDHGFVLPYINFTGVLQYGVIFGDLGLNGNPDPDDNSSFDNRWKHVADWTTGITGLSNTRMYGLLPLSEAWLLANPGDHSGNLYFLYSHAPFAAGGDIDVLGFGGLSTHDIPPGDINDDNPGLMSFASDDENYWQADFLLGSGTFIDDIQVHYVLSSEAAGSNRKIHVLLFPEDYDDPAWTGPNAVIYVTVNGYLGATGSYGVDFGTYTPVDVEMFYSNDDNAGLDHKSNWLAVLLEDPSSGWAVNVYRYDAYFDQVGLVDSFYYEDPTAGIALRLDVDSVDNEIHVLHDDGGTYRVTVLDFTP
jgi:hypothetical protein